MVDEKLFYKYQNLKVAMGNNGNVIKDDKGIATIYAILNLANNQLYFSNPMIFNDPFDCKVDMEMKGTREQWINHFQTLGANQIQAEGAFDKGVKDVTLIKQQDDLYQCDYLKLINDNIEMGRRKREDHLRNADPRLKSRKRNAREINDLGNKDSIGVCCFSEAPESILMWSHYADNHQGICISFRSRKGDIWIDEHTDQFLSLYKPSTMEIAARSIFFKVDYKDDLPEPGNFFDNPYDDKWFNFFQTKFSDWIYEREYRLVLPKTDFENRLLKYDKKSLEGVIFGLRISCENAKLVYDTVKKNYLDEGIAVNFYEAKEIPRKYAVEIEPIDDVEKYIDSLHE
ncbi:MAG: DUF2971 domain-containing protein [Methanosarcina mazei]